MSNNGFTPTERRLLELLADGMPHLRDDLRACLPVPDSDSLEMHISNLRRRLRPKGQDIVCEYATRRIHYRHVRLLSGDE